MVEYTCEVCSYTTSYTTSFKKHLKTKKHLAKEKTKTKENENTHSLLQNTPFLLQNTPKCTKILQNKQDHEIYKCMYCNKPFSRKYNLDRHINDGRCKNTPKYSKNESKLNPNESKLNPNESKLNPNESNLNLFSNTDQKKNLESAKKRYVL